MAHQLIAEGLAKVVIVSDQPEKYPQGDLPAGVIAHDRDLLDSIQVEMRDIPGVTAIIYDQTCAAEKRRRRRRGLMEDPARRVFINEEVCEGCGDCSTKTNCLSVVPLDTVDTSPDPSTPRASAEARRTTPRLGATMGQRATRDRDALLVFIIDSSQ